MEPRPADPDLAEFPNTIKRQQSSVTRADIMTEAEPSASNAKTQPSDTSSDPDSCRICRGERTADEPLFYPCKCSGSIKYVHQDCLMEWLSHSQKKHCELCKTPFRFTKLYSPNMPKRLPFHVFISHMTKYILRNLLVWLRAGLVASVWLGWLPYLMRSVWSFLFWISDEGFGPGLPTLKGSMRGGDMISLSITGTETCPSTPLLPATTTSASLGGIMDQIPVSDLLKAISKPMNYSMTQSWLRMLVGMSTAAEDSVRGLVNNMNLTQIDKVAVSPDLNPHSSLLGEVSILKNFTRSPTINRTIIAVLEGQVITLLVIVCFILIILVRDYVVQQQPEINMRAAFAAADNGVPPPPEPVNLVPHGPDPEDDDRDHDGTDDDDSVMAHDGSIVANDGDQGDANPAEGRHDFVGPRNLHERPIAGFRRRTTRQDTDTRRDGHARRRLDPTAHQNLVDELLSNRLQDGEQARLDEGDDGEDTSQTTVKDYLRIYREAGGDQDRILQIIRDEGLEDRLRYWVRVTHAMTISTRLGDGTQPDPEGQPVGRSHSTQANAAGSDTSSWTWAESDEEHEATDTPDSKGKGKAESGSTNTNESSSKSTRQNNTPWSSWDRDFGTTSTQGPRNADGEPVTSSASARPRAISDGPQRHETINPLANNNWSFSNLPSDTPSGPHPDETSSSAHTSLTSSVDRPTPSSSGASPDPDTRADTDAAVEHVEFTGVGPEDFVDRLEMYQRMDDDDENDNDHDHDHDQADHVQILNVANAQVQDTERAGGMAPQPGGIVGRVADFMWGDVEAGQADDAGAEEVVDIFGDNQNAPFMDEGRAGDGDDEDDMEMAPDVVEAAVAAGLDPEAIEDAEDFDGIMELIGMRGPVAGLFQNAIFCAFLVSISIFLGIFVPYNIGRVSVWVIANPTRIVRMVISFSKLVQDAAMLAAGYVSTFVFNLVEGFRLLFKIEQGKQVMHTLRADAKHLATGAFDRIASSFMSEIPLISASEMRNFSAISHESLVFVKNDIRYAFSTIGQTISYVFGGDYAAKWSVARDFIIAASPAITAFVKSIPSAVVHPGSLMINLNVPETASSASVNPGLAYWDANDRTWAVLLGYVSLSVLAGMYLGRGTPFSDSETAQEWEASIIDALNQASGVMKVLLIISIEMLIFPLYCGLLLDFALLPLFENTSLRSRLLFTYNYPLTSIFVHWFVGTGYMFHFALFVSMCRKIMRKGVLYFIRDPDDPEFHPVRDVLERNVTTQLRKILFSAFVYGALVIVCLGGVVWGLSLALPNVLPIHYSSNEPVLEFPIDLLFYNFLMPLAVRFFKPSDGLHAMYTWWFRRCARALRLTWFLFGERRIDEEGLLNIAEDSPYNNLPWWRKLLLEVNDQNEVAPKTWRDMFEGGKAKPTSQVPIEELAVCNVNKAGLVESGQLVRDGRFVRSPASDQVKIPKGQAVFLDVSEEDTRIDDKPDQPETDLYSGAHYQCVYVPPWFRTRILLFILFIWIFAAVTGVGITIVPLVFGRRMFKVLIPSHIRTNDIYAFSIGIYILGSLSYFVFHLGSMLNKVRAWRTSVVESMLDRHAVQRVFHIVHLASRLLYTYTVLLVVFPLLITLLVELYVLMPLHTYMYPAGTETVARINGLRDGHTIRVIQAWTLGILYLKLGSRAVTFYGGRPAQAVRAVLRRGWLEPDVGVLTRAFVIPGVTASLLMILAPPVVAWTLINQGLAGTTEMTHDMQVYFFRLAYPLMALFCSGLFMTRNLVRVFDRWQVRIRDEAYLMGERLHNFGGTAKVSVWRGSTRL